MKVTVEERRRRAATVMVRDFRKGRLGRLTILCDDEDEDEEEEEEVDDSDNE